MFRTRCSLCSVFFLLLMVLGAVVCQDSCYMSIDCVGKLNSESSSACCSNGGGLSFKVDDKCTNCFSDLGFSGEGNKFFIGFLNNFFLSSKILRINKNRIAIDPVDDNRTTVLVTSAKQGEQTFSVPREIPFPSSNINLVNVAEQNKGILITSKDGDPLSVVALAEEYQSSDAFKVLPCISLPNDRYEYYAVSVPISEIPYVSDADDYDSGDYDSGDFGSPTFEEISSKSAVVIVTTESDTVLEVTLTQNVSVNLSPDLQNQIPTGLMEAGQAVNITLPNKLATLYLSSYYDLSGSRVISSKPIAFSSGHECGTVPYNISFCDHMVEQIPPTATWGRSFIAATLPSRTSGNLFKVVASRDSTVVDVICTPDYRDLIRLDKGGIGQVHIPSSSSCYFNTSQPVLVVQFSLSSGVDNADEGDPFMVIIPPIEQYRTKYKLHSFRTLSNEGSGSYFLNVLVPSGVDLPGILLDEEQLVNPRGVANVTDVPCPGGGGVCGHTIFVANADRFQTLRHRNPNMTINAVVVWVDFRVGYSYFAGMTQKPIALPAVSFLADAYFVYENEKEVTVTLVREGDTSLPASVNFRSLQLSVENSAIEEGEDHLHEPSVAEFQSDQTMLTMRVPIVSGDVIPEQTKSFQIILTSSPGVFIQPPAVATVTIRDLPSPTVDVSFSQTLIEVKEGVGILTFTLLKTEASVGPVSVQLLTVDESARGGVDFSPINRTITFDIGVTKINDNLLILDDDVLESVEQLSLQIGPVPGLFPVSLTNSNATVFIQDNDVAMFSFKEGAYDVSEEEEMIEVEVALSRGTLDRVVEIQLSTIESSAIGGTDFIPLTMTLVFDKDTSSITVPIIITDDVMVEEKESFSASLSLVNQDDGQSVVLGRSETVITITDSDTAEIDLVGDKVVVREGEGNARVSVRVISGQLGGEVNLVYSTFNINATGIEDYIPVSRSIISLSPSVSFQERLIEIVDDSKYEDQDEVFLVQISLLDGKNAERISIQTSLLQITIKDNDFKPRARVRFAVRQQTTFEEVGRMEILVTSDGLNPNPILLDYSYTGGSARAGVDVLLPSGSLMLLPGAVLANIVVRIIDDTTPEPEKSFRVGLRVKPSQRDAVTLGLASTQITIVDSDVTNCGSLGNPENGLVHTPTGTTEGSVATYSCNDGYVPVGATGRICRASGIWTPDPPTCERANCRLLEDPVNGFVTYSNSIVGSIATYSCDEDFDLFGPSTRTCRIDGMWSQNPPSCISRLVSPPPPPNGLVTAPDYTSAHLSWIQDGKVDFFFLAIIRSDVCAKSSQNVLLAGDLRNYAVTDLEEDGQYLLTVLSINSAGNSSADIFFTTLSTSPSGPPLSFRLREINSTFITLDWDEVSCLEQNGPITGYSVSYSQAADFATPLTLITSNQFITVTGLDTNQDYLFRVAAVNSVGKGPYTTPLVVRTQRNQTDCTTNAVPCQYGSLRLRDGTSPLNGRVEVCFLGVWGTVCSDSWDATDANVACRQLGFLGSGAKVVPFGSGTGPIFLNNVKCTGNEERITDCESVGFCLANCEHTKDVGIMCRQEIDECADSQLNNCDSNAVCDNTVDSFTCTCSPGFTGDGVTCTDIDECADPLLNNCNVNANCENTEANFTCSCLPGFIGNGVSCVDINECADSVLNKCDFNANCTNSAGNFTCSCRPGYTGDGVSCTDIDECTDPLLNNCHVNAYCENTEGSFMCTCFPGVIGNGVTCNDIDECADSQVNNCDSNAVCENLVGSFTCTCHSGFTGDGVTCTDIDECADPLLNNCNVNANCENTEANFTCSCLPGFIGNGVSCIVQPVDIDECADPLLNNCDVNANCTSTVGSFTCDCLPGYTGDGVSCSDIDECAESELNNCDVNAVCDNTEGSFICTCFLGFTGDGVTCTDIDECADSELNNCDVNAVCDNTESSFICTCSPGFTGNGVSCVDAVPTFINCSSPSSCQFDIIHCPADGDCTVECSGMGSCLFHTINCPTNGDCTLHCPGDSSCRFNTIQCPDNSDCTVGCSGMESCHQSTIYCPASPHKCVINCSNAFACQKLNIVDASSNLEFNCCGESSCSGAKVEPTSSTCT